MCQILRKHVDVEATIAIIQDFVKTEQPVLQAYEILNNDRAVMQEHAKIAHLKNLLCYLRRCESRNP